MSGSEKKKGDNPFESEMGKKWKCPYCSAHQVLLEARYDTGKHRINADASIHKETAFQYEVRVCANEKCRKMLLTLRLVERQDIKDGLGTFNLGQAIKQWELMPSPMTEKNLPDGIRIPDYVRENYVMANRLREISPAASAVHSRRALSGMLNNFCGLTRDRLIDQIEQLRALVNRGKAPQWADGLEYIDLIRNTGNIGKHMAVGPHEMADVEPGEADKMIGLLEQLAEDWYAARQRRDNRGVPARPADPVKRFWRW